MKIEGDSKIFINLTCRQNSLIFVLYQPKHTADMEEELIYSEHIASSDEDIDLMWSHVSAGFDSRKNFVIELKGTYYWTDESGHGNCGERIERKYTRAVVDKENTRILCNYLNCCLLELPSEMRDRFGDDCSCSIPGHIETIFKDMTDFLVDAGCQFTIRTGTVF